MYPMVFINSCDLSLNQVYFFWIIYCVDTSWYITEIANPMEVQNGDGIKEQPTLNIFAICLLIVAFIAEYSSWI